MQLRRQVQAILFMALFFLLLTSFLIFRYVILKSFKELEEKKARVDINRVIEALNREATYLDLAIHDWASWDATYEYIADHNEKYELTSFGSDIFSTTDFYLIYYIDAAGKVVWSGVSNVHDSKTPEQFPKGLWPKDHILNMVSKNKESASGIMVLDNETAIIVSAAQILTTDLQGPPRGTVIMGRLLDENRLKKLGNQIKVNLMAWCIKSSKHSFAASPGC